jgi:predicted Zn-ribbon and HTH transcriptional regulator
MRDKAKAGDIRTREAVETVRQEITALLEGGREGARPISAHEISALAGVPEKEVYGHLEHIQKSLNKSTRKLLMTPAKCKGCGFVFKKRGRLKKPGRCPVCRGESIGLPLFSIQ